MGSARATHAGWALALVIVVSGCGLSDSAEAPTRSTLQLGPLPEQGAAIATPEPVEVAVAPPVPINGGAVAGAPAERITLPAVPGPPPIEMAFTGDTLMHSPLVDQARTNSGGGGFDFTPMFSRIAPLIGAADLAVCHLETPVAPPGQPLSTAPLYGVPPEVVSALAATGYDRCSTASNHTLDRGTAGIDATIAAFAAAGIGESGMASEPAGIEPQVFDVGGVGVSHLSYAYGFNGISLPSNEPWRSALIDPQRIIADAATARAKGAQIVIVSLHWGTEGQNGVTDAQRNVAEQITASGLIDLVVGHHAHVLQPIEQVNGVWVVYGLGNLISNMGRIAGWPPGAADGAIAEVRFSAGPDGRFHAEQPVVQPTWVDIDAGWLVRPVLGDLADPSVPDGVKAELRASLERTNAVLGAYLAAA
jgi:poly-gamma-glutamate synthesis protein (capsule biosynthesis protein)